ncbi:MAG: HEAT repeat domain-containing protein, partial [Gammaproteobacteria bacterium]|nr:HEAT repeat domain-containing protein [Gammaproteobacteria bacterium]
DKKDYVRKAAVSALGKLGAVSEIPAIVEILDDKEHYVRAAAVSALGELNAVFVIPSIIRLVEDRYDNVRKAANSALGKLNTVSTTPVAMLDQRSREALISRISAEQKVNLRIAALDALGATGRQDCAEDIYKQLTSLDKKNDASLRYRSFMWLGRMKYTDAQDDVEDELEKLVQEKAAWRKERDSENQEAASNELEEKQDKTWRKEHWEYMLGNALARIDPTERSIELLSHPFYQVRQGAIRALASRVAEADKAGVGAALIGKIIQAHQNFDPDDLPSPFPYAAFQAIDLALWNLEYTGKKDDVSKLKEILKNLQPCQIPGQDGAINERLEWTIKRLEEKLKPQAEKENQPASP